MCRFNATAPLPGAPGEPVVLDDLNDCFNWFDAIDAIDLDEDPASQRVPHCSETVKCEQQDAPGLDLVGWFQQQICTEWTGGNDGVSLAPAPATSILPPAQAETYTPNMFSHVQAPVPTSSCSAEDEKDEGQHSNGSSASPSVQRFNNSAGMDRPTRQCQYSSRQRVARVNYMEVEDKVERVKQKRRESAQRSRARKNQYMRDLEVENAGLRAQVAQLQQLVGQLQSMQYVNMGGVPGGC